ALFVHPLPFVRVVVFIATPHRGSSLTRGLLARALTRFITLPADVVGVTADLLEGNSDALLIDPRGPRFRTAYTMRPGSAFLAALAATPILPGISAHSIIPRTRAGPGPTTTH